MAVHRCQTQEVYPAASSPLVPLASSLRAIRFVANFVETTSARQRCHVWHVFVTEELVSSLSWANESFCRDALKKVRRTRKLTRHERFSMQLFPHSFGDLNHLVSLFLLICFRSHLVCMRDKLRDIFLVQRIEYVPEVISVRYTTDWQCVRKVFHELFVFLHYRPKLLDRKLVVERHVYKLNVLQLIQFFAFCEYCLKKVFVVHGLFRNVVLD